MLPALRSMLIIVSAETFSLESQQNILKKLVRKHVLLFIKKLSVPSFLGSLGLSACFPSYVFDQTLLVVPSESRKNV
ncbi:hypothetical protein ERJ70_14105 [Sediminibacillus dalangtanensis]|uniref:Uncharacterized protein n=1 Tax=Sediminibacillus dalangtanensis TaxID=2729421 RepID=A0ABX7VXR7_9BACI|nr:hypothetical protein [Sediminibacillus dalangtanensis]QTN00334.1 hypothetical protein ERJ70_14105 [Sediminibacillus dalangtanensis]